VSVRVAYDCMHVSEYVCVLACDLLV
jgi:hypothetical protein